VRRLGDVIELFDHKRIPLNSRERAQRQGQYPYYGAQGIIDHVDGYLFDGRYTLVAEDGENLNSRKLPLALFADGQFWVNNHAHVLRAKPDVADDVFLLAWLNQADIKPYVTGAAQPKLSQANLRLIEIPLPPLPIQRRIAGLVSAYDALIENNTRRIQILERMAQALYREWFIHFRYPGSEPSTRPGGHPSPSGRRAGDEGAQPKRVASRPGARNSFRETVPTSSGGGMNSALRLPEGWSVRRLAEVATVNTSTIRRGDEPENILYVDISSVGTGRIEKIEPMAFANAPGRARRIVRHGDTIWSCVRPNRKSFSLILDPPADLIASTGFAVLTPTKVPFSFLHQAVTTDEFVGYLTNHATGAAYPAVTAKDFEAAELLVPDEPLLRRFHEHCEPRLLLKENLLLKNTTLRRTRDLLLPKLISGALDVSKLDIEAA
jgi:type I restriction enzyme S subunit